jgi:hypothetical protein
MLRCKVGQLGCGGLEERSDPSIEFFDLLFEIGNPVGQR